ncbi:MAG: hypothetical protein ACQERX_02130 [Bacillota bacterium]
MKESGIKKQLKSLNMKEIGKMFQQFDKNFVTLSENQVFMQENQIEFEKYLKTIIENQRNMIGILKDMKDERHK